MAKNQYICDCSIVHHETVEQVRREMPQKDMCDRVCAFFKALGDPTRMQILWALDLAELCVCDIANILGMTKSAVSHQLSTLRAARLVKCRKEGKSVYYSLDDDHVRQMLEAGIHHTKHI